VADARVASRLRLALDMYEFGEQMARSGLRRRHPDASDEEITQMLRDWRQSRPGAVGGDAAGRPSRRFG
jgi:hypothetical protein